MSYKMRFFFSILVFMFFATTISTQTVVEIKGKSFYINGKPTYSGRYWDNNKVEGLLLNARMVQGVFDDLNPATVDTFAYADTKKWDAKRNNREFVAAMPLWKSYGLNAFSLNMQGGSPFGYGNIPCLNPGFEADGALMDGYMQRLDNILRQADKLEMVVILGLFYFGQDQNLRDEAAVIAATNNIVDWLLEKKYRNVIVEINNETNKRSYDHPILRPDRVHELIALVKNKSKNGVRLLVGTSFPAHVFPSVQVVEVSDLILFHCNSLRTAEKFKAAIEKLSNIEGVSKIPIVINEDDNANFESDTCNFQVAVKNHISWGFFDYRRKGVTDLKEGFQSIPVDWGVNSENKKAFFEKVKEISGTK